MVDALGGDYTGGNKTKIESDEIAVNASFSKKLTWNFSSWARGGNRNASTVRRWFRLPPDATQAEPLLEFAGPRAKIDIIENR